MSTMNTYGHQAMAHWQKARAAEFGRIADPTAFFSQLGSEIAVEVERRRTERERTTEAGQSEDFLANLASLNSASSVIDEVMREMVFNLPEETADLS
ncbi:hypothetical protein [Saccharothrix sp.]|uniref:hypothetical protein n=1 Tax=Saccharothrix sp. TaxID=1873460 RepID=UPI002811CC1C|nr:hypothetical protein [Saccharothrix sp.]